MCCSVPSGNDEEEYLNDVESTVLDDGMLVRSQMYETVDLKQSTNVRTQAERETEMLQALGDLCNWSRSTRE
jgi:hypothetical protein